jgi:alpha-amylase/alpha-mannosidase (GH57 family)
MDKYICIHGHFYQPPRETPGLEEIEIQDSAHPYHDWNERITAECYAPNTASRILDKDGRIADIINNYSKISFNFGPSLLSWMERSRPATYEAIIEADRLSAENYSGHGSAIAMAYNHMILPIANSRDKSTQVIWGIKDFEHRFGRFPEGMWLPETAVDTASLETLADLGISFTILAPRQAGKFRRLGRGSKWDNLNSEDIDPTMPYLCRLPSGKSIAVFFYNGPISQDVAFSGLLESGEGFARRLLGAFSEGRKHPQLVHIATDGETFGHHHRGGDMALTYCLNYIESKKLVKLTNYGMYLEKHPPTHEVTVLENSSWSCAHGIDRWRENCGCNSGMNPGWTQKWRKPLREALDELRFSTIKIFEKGTREYFHDPWKTRDHYISVILDRSEENMESFLHSNSTRELAREEKVMLLKYLEMQRNAMLMYTSCGWFFDEISGIETVQIMQYASKVMQLVSDVQGKDLEPGFLADLEIAPSNVYENGARPYELFVKPAKIDLLRVGAHYSISSIFHNYPEKADIYCYTAKSYELSVLEKDREKLVVGKTQIVSNITLEETMIVFTVLYLGYHKITAGVKEFPGDIEYLSLQKEISEAFERVDIENTSSLIHEHFTDNIFSLSHIFRDEQRKIIHQIMQISYEGIYASCRQIYDNYFDIMDFFQTFQVPLPKPFRASAEHITNRDLIRFFKEEEPDIEKIKTLIAQVKKWSIEFDFVDVGFVAGSRITALMERLSIKPDDTKLIKRIESILKLIESIGLELDIWKAQNIYFSIGKTLYKTLKESAEKDKTEQRKWVEEFRKLGYHLHVKIPV